MDLMRDLSVAGYIALLGAVGAGRLIELRLSRRHQRALSSRGFPREAEPGFGFMVALHTTILVAAAVEVIWARRQLIPILAVPAFTLFVLANLLRWWVIRTMAGQWNVQVVNALPLGVITHGPFRWIRHPNYVAVFVELLTLPLIHGAYLTALVGSALHVIVLARRIAFEEHILLANAVYRATMAGKPRFVPRRWRHLPRDRVQWPMS